MSETPLDQRRRALLVVQARLREWALRIRDEPSTAISSVYGAQTPPVRDALASQQERWVMSRDQVLAVDRMVKALPALERWVVERRYLELEHWKAIAIGLNISRAQAMQIHDTALTLLAQAMGLIGGAASEMKQEAA